ncbi:hypothetical protein E6W39_23735 [Kitasatospora acidiphila]|uniref:Uncharacterized protein n=1 Tax=Kitasatospora acidiphila TaxID=2567942 RepID=A0A540W6T1_9ACTN|nr:hypothetical protein [Kitasatospora acidiphila]TQF04683.1 hypothetical protein E6W39_23735 [Kitasatospora acidiphila]
MPIALRVVHLVYDTPAPGASQQVVHRTPIGGLVRLPAGDRVVVPVDKAVAAEIRTKGSGRAVSLKTYSAR